MRFILPLALLALGLSSCAQQILQPYGASELNQLRNHILTGSEIDIRNRRTLEEAEQTATVPHLGLSHAEFLTALEAANEDRVSEVWSTLYRLDDDDFDRSSKIEFNLLAGDIAYLKEDWDQAIHHYEAYLLFGGAAGTSEVVEERLYSMALELLEGKRKALGIFTDRYRGVVTLQNLAAWAPNSPFAPRARVAAANYLFDSRDFDEAKLEYLGLLRYHPASEYSDLATFRLGMCGFEIISGPECDGELIELTINQFQQYLQGWPNGLYKDDAVRALFALRATLANREILIGDFYRTIGNTRGARLHYKAALALQFQGAIKKARARLDELPAEDGPLPGEESESSS
ncbi:MAG: outer membrane protein assembly factor BamD [Planctomycetota bacterium]|nr:outer membrane protein assembly factor BamD [Planctomycetota bacterium]MDP6940734.1 outer membrane protein assembly factor BamD [Planctomycetota bacterium]